MAINLFPLVALHLSIPNVNSIDHTSTTAMEHTQPYSTTMRIQHRQTDTGSLRALIDTCTNQSQLAIAQSATWQIEQYSTAAS